MKKHISLWMLIARSSVYKVLILLLATAVAGAAVLFFGGWHKADLYRAVSGHSVFSACLLILCVILCRSLCRQGGQLTYTMRRLRISDKQVFWMQAGYNSVCFALLYMVQALVYVAFSALYLRAHPTGHQTLFVTAYQYEGFHMVFPLENPLMWASNIILLAGLSICTAAYPFRQRRGRRSLSTYVMLAVVLFFRFILGEEQHLGISAAAYCIPATLLVAAISLAGVLGIEEEAYDE